MIRLKRHSDEFILIVVLLKEDYILYIWKVSTVPRVSHNTGRYPEKAPATRRDTKQRMCRARKRKETPAKHFNEGLAGDV
jgi:hypothetical protein